MQGYRAVLGPPKSSNTCTALLYGRHVVLSPLRTVFKEGGFPTAVKEDHCCEPTVPAIDVFSSVQIAD